MGTLAKALSAPSAYSVKRDRPDLWAELVDRIDGAIFPAMLDEFETWMAARPLDLPAGWFDELRELIDKRREALAEEDISNILLDRCDFS